MVRYRVLPGPPILCAPALNENSEWGRLILAGALSGAGRWSEELVERREDGDANDQHRAEPDGQLLLHYRDLASYFLDCEFHFHDVLLVGQPLLEHARLFFGQDFGLGLGHARPDQALDEVMRVECKDVRFYCHEAQGNARRGLLQAGIPARMPPKDDRMVIPNNN